MKERNAIASKKKTTGLLLREYENANTLTNLKAEYKAFGLFGGMEFVKAGKPHRIPRERQYKESIYM